MTLALRAELQWEATSADGSTWELRLRHVTGEVIKLARLRRLGIDFLERHPGIWWKAMIVGRALQTGARAFADLDRAVDWAEREGHSEYGLGVPALARLDRKAIIARRAA